jgi:hypothetical protein
MPWRDSHKAWPPHVEEGVKYKGECFLRRGQQCLKVFDSSQECFIACPHNPEFDYLLTLISEKLNRECIEPVIAVKDRVYGQDIFCTKICGNIIESKFCIVVLDDILEEGKRISNPNVYYEYGLMSALNKYVIPLQNESHESPFNIQGQDIIKYNNENIERELDKAIKEARKISAGGKGYMTDKEILRKLERAGFKSKQDNWFLSDIIDDTGFKGFEHSKEKIYLYLGKIESPGEFHHYLGDLEDVVYRTEDMVQKLKEEMEEYIQDIERIRMRGKEIRYKEITEKIADIERKMCLMSNIYIGFVCDPVVKVTEFLSNIDKKLKKYKRYRLVYNINSEIIFEDIDIRIPLFSFES